MSTNHEVTNQSPVLEDMNLYELDRPLKDILSKLSIEHRIESIRAYGRIVGSSLWRQKSFEANQYTPEFHSHDQKGNRIDVVTYHPSYHDLMSLSIQHGLHAFPIKASKGDHLTRMAMYYVSGQNETGHGCPITMTFSSVPAILKYLPDGKEWVDKITSAHYDGRNIPYFKKDGLTIGMAMTEKQGGTDVRANTTRAVALDKKGTGEAYQLTGHKWFCSAPMCDAFLTLAQTDVGLSCFLFPRWKPDGTRNNFRIQRLKDKVGNKSNASSEIEFDGAFAWLMGEEGRGVATIIEMVALTRYDCMIGSSSLMRRALSEAIHHVQYRAVMGKKLIEQPLMRNVLADLALESIAALAMTVRAAICLERSGDRSEDMLLRLLTPVGKYWITKRTSPMIVEAMESLGGNGYVESSYLPRIYREAPVNAIWEGSGNVQCLDVIRALGKSPEVVKVWLAELEEARGLDPAYDQVLSTIEQELSSLQVSDARHITGLMALAMQAAQLNKLYDQRFAQIFIRTRMNRAGLMYGCLSDKDDVDYIISRIL